jgi:hypothetical protein
MMLTELTGVVAIGSIDWFVFNYLSFLLIQKPPLQNSVARSVSTMSVIKFVADSQNSGFSQNRIKIKFSVKRTFGVTRAAMTLTGSNCVGQRRVHALVRLLFQFSDR